jgi:hypothetical protein
MAMDRPPELSRDEFVKGLLGSKYKVDIWGAVLLGEPEFDGSDLKRTLLERRGIDRSSTHAMLGFLSRAGMLEVTYRGSGQWDTMAYKRLPHLGWDIAEVAVARVAEMFPEQPI